MDALIAAAARALASGDPLAALKRIALREDAAALAMRGIAMAQIGDLPRARAILRRAASAFGPDEWRARARCIVAEAEIALVSRDLGWSPQALAQGRAVLSACGDRANAAHGGYLEARRLLLIGRLDEAETVLGSVEADALPPPSRVGHELVIAGIAIRRVRTGPARDALSRAWRLAETVRIPALKAEVERAARALEAPAGRLVGREGERPLALDEVEALLASDTLVVDACRNTVRAGSTVIPLATRPVLRALLRVLAEAWPADAPRELLLQRAFGARHADQSHRARLRVEIARLRAAIAPLAGLGATRRGFILKPYAARTIIVLAPPADHAHGDVLALLSDGEAWSSSALAMALHVSPRTVQRALEALAEAGQAEPFGRGRARRWIASGVPGFPTSFLLPVQAISG